MRGLMRGVPGRSASPIPLQGDLRGSQAGDAYAHAIAELKQMRPEGGCIAITSPSQAEGKSTTAANLALALAVSHEQVLLMDLAFRRPSLERTFGESPLPYDVADVLKGAKPLQSALCVRNDIGLHVAMLKRPFQGEPTRDAIANLLREAAVEYRWVLLDCDSLAAGKAIAAILDQAAATVLVIQERKTNKKSLAKALAQCRPERTCVLLNQHR